MQTLEGTPVLVHAGPFANIAHGNSSIVADKISIKLVGKGGFVVTKAGFGADIGTEKFMNIKSRYNGLTPQCAIIVATIRALKMHGGGPEVVVGRPLDHAYLNENVVLVEAGCMNLARHVSNIKFYGVNVVVAINKFAADTEAEMNAMRNDVLAAGAFDAVVCTHHAHGGKGAVDLGVAVQRACESHKLPLKFLYPLDISIKWKIEAIAKSYGATGVEYSEQRIMLQQNLQLNHDVRRQSMPVPMGSPKNISAIAKVDLASSNIASPQFDSSPSVVESEQALHVHIESSSPKDIHSYADINMVLSHNPLFTPFKPLQSENSPSIQYFLGYGQQAARYCAPFSTVVVDENAQSVKEHLLSTIDSLEKSLLELLPLPPLLNLICSNRF